MRGGRVKVREESALRVNVPGVQRVAVDTKTKATGCQQEETFFPVHWFFDHRP